MTSPRHPDLLPISNVTLPSLGHIAIQTMNCSNWSFHGRKFGLATRTAVPWKSKYTSGNGYRPADRFLKLPSAKRWTKSTFGGCTPRWHFKEIVSPAKSCWDRKLLFWTIICTALWRRKRQCLIGWHHLCKSSESLHQSRPSGVFGWMFFTYIFHVLTIKNETWII